MKEAGVEGNVQLTGPQTHIYPFLRAAAGFAFPTGYETFSFAGFEAAAGPPLIVTPVRGLEELIGDGQNGIQIEPTIDSLIVPRSSRGRWRTTPR